MRVKGLTILTDILNSNEDRLACPVHRDALAVTLPSSAAPFVLDHLPTRVISMATWQGQNARRVA
jgi:hypothetical protein